MKTKLAYIKKSSLLVLTFLLIPYLSSYANDGIKCSKDQIKNLERSIKSENCGVKKDGIYLAGKYKVKELADPLIEILRKEKDPVLLLLATYALFQIDERSATYAVLELVTKNPDENLSKILMNAAVVFAQE